MYCFVTKFRTNNKWKGKVIHPIAVKAAKIKSRENGLMLRENLRDMQTEINKLSPGKMEFEDYLKAIHEILGVESE